MKTPELPTTLFSTERVDDLLSPRVLLQETRTIVHNLIDHNDYNYLEQSGKMNHATYTNLRSQQASCSSLHLVE
jgi:hypothetical protein